MARSKFEKVAQKSLEAYGYKVDYKLRPTRPTPNYNVDYWNLFDLAAYKPNQPLRFISVKGNGGVPSEHRKRVEQFVAAGIDPEIWHFRKLTGKGRRSYLKIERFDGEQWNTIFDEGKI